MAKAENPKLVLLDLNLPDISGAEVLDTLQANPQTSDIPVVVLSANESGSQIERLLAAGARNYLTKPFKPDHFLAVVDEWTRSAEKAD
jgi:CheY-like chemotaxis protein